MVDWSPSVSVGCLIKNKLGKCFSAAVNLASFRFFGSGTLSGLHPLTAGSGQEAPARWLALSRPLGRPRAHVPLAEPGPTTRQAQCRVWGDLGTFRPPLGMICN